MSRMLRIGDRVRIVAGGALPLSGDAHVAGKTGVVTWIAPGELVQVVIDGDNTLGAFTRKSLELVKKKRRMADVRV